MQESIIRFSNFTWQYESQAEPTLRGLSFDIKKGEKVLICGPSGCGKSTISHCLNGLIPFSYRGKMTGSLSICGKETKDLSIFDLSKMVGTVLQDSDGQFVGLTVAEDIAFALENDCVPQKDLIARVNSTSQKVDTQKLLSAAPHELSGGQKQRVSLAGVMVDDVPILLFDEPLANLDPATGKHSIELIDEIQKQSGATVIIIEHRLEDVLWKSVDRILLMGDGVLLADMKPSELLCTDLLKQNGIREPLYITALKYAGVQITQEMHPESINTLCLNQEEKSKLQNWFNTIDSENNDNDNPVQLSLDNINFSYEKRGRVLSDISFDIRRGEMLSIVGKNGAGKSTLSKLICGFIKPESGTMNFLLDGNMHSLSEYSIKERADHIGYVMQNPNQMISKIMISEEVALGLVTRNVDEQTIKQRVDDTLKICGLYSFRNWPISALSYGQKKRVTIASILALNPEIIILDEPTAGQDYRHYTDIMEFLKELNERGVTVILITHDMHLMMEYCKRSIVITDGKIIADTSPAQVLTNKELVEKAYLKETSLYELSHLCGIDDGCAFTQRFIDYERRLRGGQNG